MTVATIYARQSNQEKHTTREVLPTTRVIEDRWQAYGSRTGIDFGRARGERERGNGKP